MIQTAQFDAVGQHSWEALCEDCHFGFLPTLAEFRRMALALMPAWQKVSTLITREPGVTEAEIVLLSRMTQLFEQHRNNALSMSQR